MRIIDVEQGSREWHGHRQGKVTGTRTKSALGKPPVQHTLLCSLVAERMSDPQISDFNSAAVDRGNEMEPFARKAVIEETGIEFVETGMLVSDDLPMFGLSPDAIYFDEAGVVTGGLETKCPGTNKHIEYLIAGDVPKEYYHQVYAPFLLDDSIQWWIFASYDDRCYERPLSLVTVTREDFDEIEEDREKLAKFLIMVDQQHEALTF